jgi:hypothetical protein
MRMVMDGVAGICNLAANCASLQGLAVEFEMFLPRGEGGTGKVQPAGRAPAQTKSGCQAAHIWRGV